MNFCRCEWLDRRQTHESQRLLDQRHTIYYAQLDINTSFVFRRQADQYHPNYYEQLGRFDHHEFHKLGAHRTSSNYEL